MHHTVDNLRWTFHGAGGNESAWRDGVTKATYGQNLEENLRATRNCVRCRIDRKVRRVEIPKEDGTIRPWGLAASKTRSFRDDATDLGSHLRTGVYQDLLWLPSREELPRCPATTQSRGNEPTGELDRGPRSSSVFDTMPHLETTTAADQGQEISAIGSANAESRVQTPGGLCRVNWEVRKARLSPRCWRIYSGSRSTNGL